MPNLNKAFSNIGQFFKFTTSRPVAIIMVVLAVCVFGAISYKQLRVNLMPDISYPSLTVRTEYEGAAPEEVETAISRPVEQALGVVNHLVNISSISKAGQSDVKLEFSWDTEMNEAVADVREKLDQVFLPEEVQRPIILRFDPTLDPIIRLGLYGERSLIYLRHLGEEEIKRALERIEGVAAIKVKGGLEEEIRVELNEQQLTLIGIDIQAVRQRLRQENVNLAGGNLKEGQTEYLVRTLNEFKTVPEVGEVVIGQWNGKEIKVKDIARVHRTFKDREIVTRIDNAESVEIEIFKEADANIVAVAASVRDRIFGTDEQRKFVEEMKHNKDKKPEKKEKPKEEATNGKGKDGKNKKGKGKRGGVNPEELRKKKMTDFISYSLPAGVKIDLLSDQSVFIQNSVDDVERTAVYGGLLAIVVLFVFLRKVSTTLIIGLSIPISIVATFAPMRIFDVSLNIMSLGGLALGIGMLVDNSIVVLESISRCRDEGDNLLQATIRGVGEVGGAVFASTLTTVAVFFPIVFVEGVAGQIFGNMALTVVFSLCASLCVALFVIPMLASRESSKFTAGIKLDKVVSQNVLVFKNEVRIRNLLAENAEERGLVRFADIVLEIMWTFLWLLYKVLIVFGALLVTLLKYIVLLVTVVVSPFVTIVRRLMRKEKAFGELTSELALRPHIEHLPYLTTTRLEFMAQVWPTYAVCRSVPELYSDMHRFLAWFTVGDLPRRIVYSICCALVLAFFLLKFVLYFVVELLAKVVIADLMVLGGLAMKLPIPGGVFLKGLYLVGRLLFTLPSRHFLRGFNFLYSKLEDGYPKLLQKSLNNRGSLLASVGVLFVATLLFIGPQLGSELIPEVHQGEFNLELTLPVGTPVEQTDARLAPIQAFIKSRPEVARVASVAGTDKTANTSSEEGEHTSKMTITMSRDSVSHKLLFDEEALIATIRDHLKNYSGIQSKISRPVLFSFRTPIEVEIHGFNLQKLQAYSRELEERMSKIPGVIDIKSNIQRGNPEVQIAYNRPLLAQFGLNVMDVASIVRNKVRGDVATEFKEQDRRIDVLVRLREQDKQSIDDLRRVVINPGAERPIPLEAVANIKVKEGPSEIRRVDQQRTAVISANISGRSLSKISEDIIAELHAMNLPDDFSYALAGQNKEMATSLNSLQMALALAIFLVYVVMASQFESMLHPLIIIFTIPLALVGVIWWLFAFQIPLSIMVFLGLIMLAGIVVNNAIVLVDYINTLRERGMAKMEAIIEAGRIRLRPILMTTLTTVLGLLPMALGLGDGAEIRTPMAITVIVGLISSTILTLVIIPTVYSFTPELAEGKRQTADGA